jgi:hypothetical protein
MKIQPLEIFCEEIWLFGSRKINRSFLGKIYLSFRLQEKLQEKLKMTFLDVINYYLSTKFLK